MREYPQRLHHQTPGWVKDGALFHIRIRTETTNTPPLTEEKPALSLLDAARRYHELGHWWCELFLLMPDHVHALLAFPRTSAMSDTLRNWKRITTRLHQVQWQSTYFDHRIRNAKAGQEAWLYIRRNPVVKGLCATEDDWPWWWSALG